MNTSLTSSPESESSTLPTEAGTPAPQTSTSGTRPTKVKTFVLDTNVLIHNPKAIFVFQDNNIVVPFPVLEELDHLKRGDDDVARNARQTIRYLDAIRRKGSLVAGVKLGTGANTLKEEITSGATGILRIDVEHHERPPVIEAEKPDNCIIAVAYALRKKGERVVFVSKDFNARLKSDVLGIRTEDFENQKVNVDRLYNGYLTLNVADELIDNLYRERMLPIEQLKPYMKYTAEDGTTYDDELLPNQFVLLISSTDEGHTGLGRRLADTEHVIPVSGPRKPVFGIIARNVQQTMALDLLLDDEIKMVTLLGSAGTGKTLLAVAAGMTKVFNDDRFEKLLVARPIMPMGRDIGYLPGDKDEKLTAWMQPIFDNLAYLMSTRGSPLQSAESHSPEQRINRLMADGRLVLEPLTYIRGRSIPHQFMIVDEAQNLTPHDVKTIVSRVGEGTKSGFTGDIGQIDHP
ncbi:MAG: PhoH family protein, partial [Phycisphaerales bacterium]|nr:PhoH family protein [Phycisphaerales bacterium]